MGIFRKTPVEMRRARAPRRIELSGLGAERLEGRALLSHVAAHLTPAEIATFRADHAAAHDAHHHAPAGHDFHHMAHPGGGAAGDAIGHR